MNVTFKVGDHVALNHLSNLKMAKRKAVQKIHIVFNNLLNTLGEFKRFLGSSS